MKALLLAIVLCVGAGVGIAVAADEAPKAPATQPATQPAAKPINKFCAVEKDQEVDPSITYVYKGKVIGFCCDDCPAKFKKNPEKYMKDLK